MACANKRTPEWGTVQGRILETFVEYLPRPRQLGKFPPGPPRRACRPPLPPAQAADYVVGAAGVVRSRRRAFSRYKVATLPTPSASTGAMKAAAVW